MVDEVCFIGFLVALSCDHLICGTYASNFLTLVNIFPFGQSCVIRPPGSSTEDCCVAKTQLGWRIEDDSALLLIG